MEGPTEEVEWIALALQHEIASDPNEWVEIQGPNGKPLRLKTPPPPPPGVRIQPAGVADYGFEHNGTVHYLCRGWMEAKGGLYAAPGAYRVRLRPEAFDEVERSLTKKDARQLQVDTSWRQFELTSLEIAPMPRNRVRYVR